MKHKFTFFAILMMAMAIPQSVKAYDYFEYTYMGQTLYYLAENGEAQVSNQQGAVLTGNLEIPATVTYNDNTYSVTSIGGGVFSYNSGLTSVTIPNSVTSIGQWAFYECSGLTSVTIGNSVTSIGEDAFYGCSSLTSLNIPNSVTSIGSSAFCNCSSMTSVTIGNSITSISNYAFSNCSSLTSLTFGNSVTSIGDGAFGNCSSLTSVIIPNSVTSIGNYAFHDCSSLTSVTIPNSVTSIGDGAFARCSGLTSIAIPSSVTSVSEETFSECSGMISVTIPNSVTSIGNLAFSACSGLTSVTIPNSVTSIGDWAFVGCSGLTSVVVTSGNPYYDSRENCNAIIETSTNTLITGCQNTVIPNSVTSIGNSAFAGCNLPSVIIPNSVTSIGNSAFGECSGLTSVTIPNSVTSIGEDAFYGCSGLTSVTIGSSVESIGNSAFYGCSDLSEIICLNPIVPTLGTDVFTEVTSTIPVHVPCGRLLDYITQWGYFSNFVEAVGFTINATSADATMGDVVVLTQPTCQAPTAEFIAVPNNGYRFDHWSDSNTDNPRSLTLTSDTAIVAYFTQNVPDTVYVYIHDTTLVMDTVTVDNYIYDTTVVTDTLRLTDTVYIDTLYIVDTVYITDTVYVGVDNVAVTNVKIYVQGSEIVVENAEGYTVSLYDFVGRMLATKQDGLAPVRFAVPTSGTYLVKVGDLPARKIVVVR